MFTEALLGKHGTITQMIFQTAKDFALPGVLKLTGNDEYAPEGHVITGEAYQGTLLCKPKVTLKADDSVITSCNCGAWYRNKRENKGDYCMHTLALAIMADGGAETVDPSTLPGSGGAPRGPRAPRTPGLNGATPSAPGMTKRKSIEVFRAKVSQHIAKAVAKLADIVEDHFAGGDERVLFLAGGTGTGKTSAVRIACDKYGYQFVFFSGDGTTTYDSAWGMDVGNVQTSEKEFGWAFRFAREGKKTVLFIDEMLRLNEKFRDAMMKLIQPERAKDVRAMLSRTSTPLPDDMPDETLLYVGKASFWEMQWAPADNLRFIVAANPWGDHKVDAAFARRCYPIYVEYDEQVLKPFSSTIQEIVKRTWTMYAEGGIQLPIEYGNLSKAEGANDKKMIEIYLQQLRLSNVEHYAFVSAELSVMLA